jgi:hypothetical protein
VGVVQMAFPIPLEILLLLSLPFLLVGAVVASCVLFLRGATRRWALGGVALVVTAVAAFVAYHLVGPGRYAEFEDIQARLRALPGVTLLDASGHEDVTFEIDGFTIDVEDRGVISFGSLSRESFEHADHLPVLSIGGDQVIVVREGYIGVYRADTKEPVRSTGWGYGIDVGPEGPFSRFFPFALDNVQSVLDRYEEICAELATWPMQPEYASFQDEEGIRYFYALRDPASDEAWIHPTELEPVGGEGDDR